MGYFMQHNFMNRLQLLIGFVLLMSFCGSELYAAQPSGINNSPSIANLTGSIKNTSKKQDDLVLKEGEYVPGEVVVKVRNTPDSSKASKYSQNKAASESFEETFQRLGGLDKKPLFRKKNKTGLLKTSMAGGRQLKKFNEDQYHRLSFPKTQSLKSVIEDLRQNPLVEFAEPNYIRNLDGGLIPDNPVSESQNSGQITALPSQSTDPYYQQQWHLDAINAPLTWQFLEDHNINPGGSSDVVVAVIDTGVDYTHPDLAGNMWINTGEIQGNGIDDDGNGFVDDIYGANVVSSANYHTGNPMDDHGHGTHVAGIACAQGNNNLGVVGVAYNTRIMAIKAAQYNGVLTTSDIAEAILYAVDKGADVINMSFGGYSQSMVEEDALVIAFGQAVLVAAAGNNGLYNESTIIDHVGKAMFPAAYPWVLGVMASNRVSSPNTMWSLAEFSNKDRYPQNNLEYELMAPGVDIYSTLPNSTYAAWSGTSMATPVVSGVAALLRSYFSDKDTYPSRFIMGQIAATGQFNGDYRRTDASSALTILPQPNLSFQDYWLFDTKGQAEVNDDDGRVDAGETVSLALMIRNHWGKADNVQVTIEPVIEGATGPDPYVNMIIPTVDYGAVGSFNTDDNGLIYDAQGVITGVQHPFTFSVSADCPNDHIVHFKVTMTCKNGYDLDQPFQIFEGEFSLTVQRGRELPRIISENMELTKDDLWIVSGQTLIQEGVTVTVKEGTNIQWGTPDPDDPYSTPTEPYLQVEGILNVMGTFEEPVELYPSDLMTPTVRANISNGFRVGQTNMSYVRVKDPALNVTNIDHAFIYRDNGRYMGVSCNLLSNSIIRIKKLWEEWVYWEFGFNVSEMNTVLQDESRSGFGGSNHPWRVFNSVFLQDNQNNSPGKGLIHSQTPYSDKNSAEASTSITNNAFLSKYWDPNIAHWMRISANTGNSYFRGQYFGLANNYWGTTSTTHIDAAIDDIKDNFNSATIVYEPILTVPSESTYPFVANLQLSTLAGTNASVFGIEPMVVTVTYNRDMDITMQPMVSFGPDVPMTDFTVHPINGGWMNARTWKGTFNITATTGDGYQLLRVGGGRAASDHWLVAGQDAGRFRFEIITSGTESLNLQATGGEGFIDLMWTQDDYDLLAGFNLYRSSTQNGGYIRLNSTVIPVDQRSYRDPNVQPGQQYFYKFKVVQSDLSESDFSNTATATPTDTIPPVLTHSPISSVSPGLPLTLYAEATDNVHLQTVILFYRKIGQAEFSIKGMVNTSGSRYSATLEGSILSSPGIEYYIEAFDGISKTTSGRAEHPWQINIIDKPVVTAISPSSGPATGGTNATISGTNFKAGAAVRLGGSSCNDIAFISSNQITVTTPAHFSETVDVEVVNPDAQSATLLRGFTFTSTAVSISMPNLERGQHQIVQVPIALTNVEGMVSADLTISFDQTVLQARGVTAGSLVSGWPLAVNIGTPGQIRISMASNSGAVSATGPFINLELEITGTPGSNSPLTFSSVMINDGAIPVELVNGQVTVGQVYSVSGDVRYWNEAIPIPDVNMNVVGDHIYSATTQINGSYVVGFLPPNDYSLTPSKSNSATGITAYDASLVLKHGAGLQVLEGNPALAADVNKSGSITSMDAYYILQKSVDLITLPFNGSGRVWEFSPSSFQYTNLASNIIDQNFTGVLLGDVSGNWNSGSEPLNINSIENRQNESDTVFIHAPTMNMVLGHQGVATLSMNPNAQGVNAVNLELIYDPLVVTPLSVSLGNSIPGWLIATNLSKPGVIKIGLAGANPVSGTGDLIKIVFDAKGGIGTKSNLSFSVAEANEGRIPVATTSGEITILNGYTLEYSAGDNGSILGISTQIVVQGGDGSEVKAIANSDYYFVKWSDDSTENPRKDSNVTSNISVTAVFEPGKGKYGDIDGNDGVDLKDAISGLKILIGLPQSLINKGADVNHDQKIGNEEVIYILKEISEKQ